MTLQLAFMRAKMYLNKFLTSPTTPFGDDRDNLWKSDTKDFADMTFQEVVESALYTSQNMFGSIQFEAERELYRRLMVLYPEPEWKKGKK